MVQIMTRVHLRFALVLVPLLLLLLAVASPARAAESYNIEEYGCAGSWGGGQYDRNGTHYVACGTTLHVYGLNGGHWTHALPVFAHDVAPSPDGTYVYISDLSSIRRMNWNGATYVYDQGWGLGTFTYAGARAPRPYWVATDAWGSIYITEVNFNTIVKYRPDGTAITRFGEYTTGNAGDASSWKPGEFYWRTGGLGVSRDGRHVYVGEVGNNRVQRFDWQPNGTYSYSTMWGNTREYDPTRAGSCAPGRFAAPYDVGVDPWGYVYVANTTCSQIQKFTRDGQHVYSTPGQLAGGAGTQVRNHGLAVDAHGNASSGEPGKRMVRTTPEPGPWPALEPLETDTTAPVLNTVTVPATTTTREITISIAATDNRAVTHVRIANEDGTYGAWLPFAANVAHTLSANYGTKGVFVQVRDKADNRSAQIYKTLAYKAPPGEGPDLTAPVITAVTVPATTANRTITVAITETDNKGVTQMRLANEDGAWGAWVPFAANVQHTLSANYGAKGVFVQVRDAVDNRTQAYRATKYDDPNNGPDNIAPVLTGVTLPASTNAQTVGVSLAATDNRGITGYRIANEDGTWGAWAVWTTPIAHTLTNGYGTKTLFVQVRDAAGNDSAVKSATTAYKAPVPPTPRITTFTAPTRTSTRAITVRLAVSGSRATQVRFANENGTFGGWRTYSGKLTHRLTRGKGTKRVFVQVRNKSGVRSKTLNRKVTLR